MLTALVLALAAAAPPAPFRAGAARLDITPAPDAALPMSGYAGRTQGHTAIRDPLFARAIVVEDAGGPAAIVSVDVIGFSHAARDRIAARIEKEAGVPAGRLLLAGVHTHGAPAIGTYGEAAAKPAQYVAWLDDRIVEAVRTAREKLAPARAGFGAGRASVNTNRIARMAYGGWWLGVNPDGVSDKTVAVLRFDDSAGKPFAVFANYAVHGTVLGQQNTQITGDLPGAAARVVERDMEGVVAAWTSGAAGDQNAIYGPGTSFEQLDALGAILGDEIVRVARGIKTLPGIRIAAAQKTVACPGQKTAPGATRRDPEIQFVDADPVEIRLSLLKIGDVALAGVSGEVLTLIGTRLKKEAGPKAVMVTHCNGSSGYIPDDAAYGRVGYEIMSARMKSGCAEDAIVKGFVEMLRKR